MLSPCVSVPSVRLLCSKGSLGSARTSRSWLIMTNYDCFSQISLCSFTTPTLTSQWLFFLARPSLESLRSTFVSPVETMVLLFQCPRHLASDSLLLLWTLTKIETVSSTWLPLSWSYVGVSTTECCFRFGPAASFFLELLVIALCSSPVAHWTPSDKRAHLLLSYLLAFWYSSWDSCRRSAGVCCHFLLQWTMFYQHSSLWPICLGWPCMAWLIASLAIHIHIILKIQPQKLGW